MEARGGAAASIPLHSLLALARGQTWCPRCRCPPPGGRSPPAHPAHPGPTGAVGAVRQLMEGAESARGGLAPLRGRRQGVGRMQPWLAHYSCVGLRRESSLAAFHSPLPSLPAGSRGLRPPALLSRPHPPSARRAWQSWTPGGQRAWRAGRLATRSCRQRYTCSLAHSSAHSTTMHSCGSKCSDRHAADTLCPTQQLLSKSESPHRVLDAAGVDHFRLGLPLAAGTSKATQLGNAWQSAQGGSSAARELLRAPDVAAVADLPL